MAKILIFVPAFGHTLTAATFLSTHALNQQLAARGVGCGVASHSFPDIAELREMAVTIFHDATDFTHLLFVDADMAFPPDLVLDMLLLDEPVIGSIYRQRKEQVSWAGSGDGRTVTERRGGFMKVEGVGMGCSLIRRDAIATMMARMPHLIDTRLELHPARDLLAAAGVRRLFRCFEKLDFPGRGVISEDLSFCLRWGQCGGSVWAAIGHRISHVGMYDYAGRFLDSIESAPQTVSMPAPAAVLPTAAAIPLPADDVPAVLAAPAVAAAQEAAQLNGGGAAQQEAAAPSPPAAPEPPATPEPVALMVPSMTVRFSDNSTKQVIGVTDNNGRFLSLDEAAAKLNGGEAQSPP